MTSELDGEEIIPDQLPPPVVGKVGHFSAELSWDQDYKEDNGAEGKVRRHYSLQEEEVGTQRGFGNVYSGYSRSHVLKGLEPNTTYRYRVRTKTNDGTSPWSTPVTLTTTKVPLSGGDLFRAVKNWEVEAVKKILDESEGSLIDVPDVSGMSALMLAAQKGYSSIVETLVEHGAQVNFVNSSGKTSVMLACFGGHLSIVQYLCENGADLSKSDNGGACALHCAVDGDKHDVVTWLLENDDVEVDQEDHSGWSPLLRLANVAGSARVAKALIDKKANVNKKDKSGTTALMMAALAGQKDLCQVLVENGADIQVTNEFGRTALDFAESFGRRDVIRYLNDVITAKKQAENQVTEKTTN